MTIGQSSTSRIDYLNQTRRDCSSNWKEHKECLIPDAQESRRFWSDIWEQAVTNGENADWRRTVENEQES